MKPVFISNNKLFYSAMLIICLGIIIVGINYNKNEAADIKSSNHKLGNAISVDKKVNTKPIKVLHKLTPKKTSINKKKNLKSIKKKVSIGNEESFFDNYKIDRDRTRDKEIELLREIINNPQSDKVTRQDAQKKLFSLTQNLEKEMDIENIIKANGFSNSVTFIHKPGVTVVMQNLKLTKSQMENVKTKVIDIAALVTGEKKENIEVLFKK